MRADTSSLVERSRFLAAGQDDPHSVTITELCDRLESLDLLVERMREALENGASIFRYILAKPELYDDEFAALVRKHLDEAEALSGTQGG